MEHTSGKAPRKKVEPTSVPPKTGGTGRGRPKIVAIKTKGIIFNNLGTVITDGFNCSLAWFSTWGIKITSKQLNKEVSRIVPFESIDFVEVE